MDIESDDYYVILVDKDANQSGIQVYNLEDIKPSESDIIKKECEYLLSEDPEEVTNDELKTLFYEVPSNNYPDRVRIESPGVEVKIESPNMKVELNDNSCLEDETTSTNEKWDQKFAEYLHIMEERDKAPPPPISEIPFKKISDDIYKCKYCEISSLTEKLAIRHYRFKHGERYHVCLACKSTYRRRDTLLLHESTCQAEMAHIMRVARQTVIANRKPSLPKKEWKKVKLPCAYCEKFITRGNMSQHIKIHLGIQPTYQRKVKTFICDVCQATFERKRSLEAHINIHFDRKPYVCKTCGKAFYNSNILLGHKWIHAPRRFKCDFCERTYRKKVTLSNHIRTRHPDGLPGYLCNKCGKQIASRSEWDDHMMLHKVMNYPCSDCEKTFTNIHSLNGHMKRNHGKQILTREKFLKKLPQLREVPGILFDVVTN